MGFGRNAKAALGPYPSESRDRPDLNTLLVPLLNSLLVVGGSLRLLENLIFTQLPSIPGPQEMLVEGIIEESGKPCGPPWLPPRIERIRQSCTVAPEEWLTVIQWLQDEIDLASPSPTQSLR